MDRCHLCIIEQRNFAGLEQPPVLFTQGLCFNRNRQCMVKAVTGCQHTMMRQQAGIAFAKGCNSGIRQFLGTEQGIENAEELKGDDLKKLLIEKLGL